MPEKATSLVYSFEKINIKLLKSKKWPILKTKSANKLTFYSPNNLECSLNIHIKYWLTIIIVTGRIIDF